MSSTAAHRVINTRERGTSTDINRIIQLADRNANLAAWYLAQNDASEGGVLTGLRVTVDSGTVSVNPGLGLLNDSVAGYPDSPYSWLEVRAGTTITKAIAGNITGEWMVIELGPRTKNVVTISVDVFDPTTSSFSSVSKIKEVESDPEIFITTSGAANQFPSATANRMPLAFLYDDGGALTSNHLVHCRPLLWSKGPMQTSDATLDDPDAHPNKQWIQGGGVSVTADGTTITLEAIAGRFYGHRQAFAVNKNITLDLSDANAWIGGAKSVAEEAIYIYAVPPPYPVYSGLAQREFVVGSVADVQFSTVGVNASDTNQTGCILVASTTAPDSTGIGVQGATSASLAVFDVPFRDGGASASVAGRQNVYVGTIDWATSLAKAQTFLVGESRVVPESRWPFTDIKLGVAPATNLPIDLQDGVATGGITGAQWPAHANAIRAIISWATSAGGDFTIQFSDDDIGASAGVDNSYKSISVTPAAAVATRVLIAMELVQTGATIGSEYSSATLTEVNITSLSYVDAIIAAR